MLSDTDFVNMQGGVLLAVSKNNRKKGKKRTASRPPSAGNAAKHSQQTVAASRGTSASTLLKGLALLLMIVGLAIVSSSGHVVGFPLSIAGAIIGLLYVRRDQHFRFVTRACYGIFIAVMICYWISSVRG